MVPYWLICEIRLEKRLESGIKKESAIVIIISTRAKVTKLCSKEQKFNSVLKIVEKYWEAG